MTDQTQLDQDAASLRACFVAFGADAARGQYASIIKQRDLCQVEQIELAKKFQALIGKRETKKHRR
jgi:hypothetical protein